jgi:branched-chain amino acid transport system substrate-binding protein
MRIVAVATCLALLSCTQESTNTIVIGSVVSLTGDCASGVDEIVEAANLAIEEINANKGVLGAKLTLVTRDDQSTEEGVVAATKAVLKDNPVAILGAVCSGQTIKMSEQSIAAGVPSISPISTSPLISNLADDGLVFRTAPSDALQGKLIAERARARGFTTMSIMHDPDAYGEGLRDRIALEFEALGGTILAKRALPESVTDASAEWSQLLAPGRPQAVAMVTFPGNAGPLLATYKSLYTGGGEIVFYFSEALKQEDFLTQLGSVASGFDRTVDNNEVMALGAPGDANYSAFVARFQAKYGRAPDLGTGSPQAYDAIYLMALGLQSAGTATASALKAALGSVSKGGTAFTSVQFTEAVTALSAGDDIDYVGVTGPCDFDDKGDVVGVYNIWRVTPKPTLDFALVESSVSP